MGPMILTANPGPGNGCLETNSFGIPNFIPIFLTSSLYNSFNGSMISSIMLSGSVTLW